MVGGSLRGTLASSTTKTGRHDIAEILLKVALNTINQTINQSLTWFTNIFFCQVHHSVTKVCTHNGNSAKLYMIAYNHRNINISVKHFNWTVYVGIIDPFLVRIFHQKVCACNSSYILNGYSSKLNPKPEDTVG